MLLVACDTKFFVTQVFHSNIHAIVLSSYAVNVSSIRIVNIKKYFMFIW